MRANTAAIPGFAPMSGLVGTPMTLQDTILRLSAIRGIGEEAAHYVAMRAFCDPDAFPGLEPLARAGAAKTWSHGILEVAEGWRPWRAYAAMHLWADNAAI
jgi:3-methyladenine DNA glycosylase/8-oxoguanine DNA glycosylase